jgi:hypothetical protein
MLSPLNCCDVRKPIGTLGEFPLQSKSYVSDFDHLVKCRTRVNPSSDGERVRVKGFEPIEGLSPPHPTPLPKGEREQTEFAALLWTRRTDFHHA